MHTLHIDVKDSVYEHVIYLLQSMKDVHIKKDSITKQEPTLLERVQEADDDIKHGRVSGFDFNAFKKDLDEL
jgi:lipopolysaccharide biosynthesis protein